MDVLSIAILNVQGSAATNGSVPINAGILTPKSNSQEDRNKVGDYSTYMEIEEVPLRYHPLYLSNMLDVCSPSNLQKAGWEDVSTCPLQSVAGIGGNDLNGNVELVVPSTLQGMPFLSKLRVFANPRMGFASMRMDFYDPSGTKYNSVVRFFGKREFFTYQLPLSVFTLHLLLLFCCSQLEIHQIWPVPKHMNATLIHWKSLRICICFPSTLLIYTFT